MEITDKYINPYAIKYTMLGAALVSIILMLYLEYDDPFRISVLLPLVYFASAALLISPRHIRGIGCTFLFGMYCFRMCVLPVICAYGKFWIEPDRQIYIDYFGAAIILMCIECLIVLGSLRYYSRLYTKRPDKFIVYRFADTHNDSMIILFAKATLAVYMLLFIINPRYLTHHYRFLIVDHAREAADDLYINALQNMGGKLYYMMVIMDSIARPGMVFVLVDWLLKKGKKGMFLSVLVGMICILWVTDRRILSFMMGVICFVQILLKVRDKMLKAVMNASIAVLALITLAYCFNNMPNPEMYSRSFQRFFSGPALTAINIRIYLEYFQTPLTFLKQLYNNSLLLTGLLGRFKGVSYTQIVAKSRSIWVPAMIGSIQYFHVLGFFMLIPVVKFLVYSDYVSMHSTQGSVKMMMNYLTISLAIYMTMYYIELLYYHIIARGGFYFLLLWLNRHVEVISWSRIKYFRRCRYEC